MLQNNIMPEIPVDPTGPTQRERLERAIMVLKTSVDIINTIEGILFNSKPANAPTNVAEQDNTLDYFIFAVNHLANEIEAKTRQIVDRL